MKRFNYIWKSSDGIRHVDSAKATSREELFSRLRQTGIRAIKVEEIIPRSHKIAKFVVCFSAIGVIIGSVLWAYKATVNQHENRMSRTDSQKVSAFFSTVDRIVKDYDSERNRIKNEQGYREQKLNALIDLTRARVRFAHREASKTLHDDSTAKRALYRRYGEITDYLDEQELALENDSCL